MTFSFFIHLSFAFCRHSPPLVLRFYDGSITEFTEVPIRGRKSPRLEARCPSFFSCARRNRSSTDVVLSREGFPNRFRYQCSIDAIRRIFTTSSSPLSSLPTFTRYI